LYFVDLRAILGGKKESSLKKTKLDERFFDSTRGRIVTMLRGATHTVEELAERLELTDNAVRAHLATLERDGLVRQKGVRRGFRKPHYTYTLSHEAEALFPKAYDVLLNRLLEVLKERLPQAKMEEVLRDVGRSLADTRLSRERDGNAEARAEEAVQVLAQLGGKAVVERDGNRLFIRSDACPVASAVAEHPEVCVLAEALVAEIVGAKVQEHCNREKTPKCCFELVEKA
jgi:predicted ArsR family transcriptional regulator